MKMPEEFLAPKARTLADLRAGERSPFPLHGVCVDLNGEVFVMQNTESCRPRTIPNWSTGRSREMPRASCTLGSPQRLNGGGSCKICASLLNTGAQRRSRVSRWAGRMNRKLIGVVCWSQKRFVPWCRDHPGILNLTFRFRELSNVISETEHPY